MDINAATKSYKSSKRLSSWFDIFNCMAIIRNTDIPSSADMTRHVSSEYVFLHFKYTSIVKGIKITALRLFDLKAAVDSNVITNVVMNNKTCFFMLYYFWGCTFVICQTGDINFAN